MQKLEIRPQSRGHTRQTLPSQDTITNEEMVKLLEEVTTIGELQRRLGNRICETISVIDSELAAASDTEYRRLLVKAAYALRDLEEWLQKSRLLVTVNQR